MLVTLFSALTIFSSALAIIVSSLANSLSIRCTFATVSSPAIDEQNAIIKKEEQKLTELLAPYTNELQAIDEKLVAAETWQTEGKVKELQALIGVTADGNFGYRSRTALKKFKDETEAKRIEVLEQINTIKAEKENNPIITAIPSWQTR